MEAVKLWDNREYEIEYCNYSLNYIDDRNGGLLLPKNEEVTEIEAMYNIVMAGLCTQAYRLRGRFGPIMLAEHSSLAAFQSAIEVQGFDVLSVVKSCIREMNIASGANNPRLALLGSGSTTQDETTASYLDELLAEHGISKGDLQSDGGLTIESVYYKLLANSVSISYEDYWYKWDLNNVIDYLYFNRKEE